jgi:undecaprenyl-diphosphatase
MTALLLGVAAFLGWKRNWPEMTTWIALIVGTLALSVVLKAMVPRSRPPGGLAMIPNDSFPSGHAMIALAGYGMLVHLLNKSQAGRRTTQCVTAAWIFLVAMIGLSRLCIGDHYPSDIIAGYAAGGLCLLAAVAGLNLSASRWGPKCAQ